MSAWQANVELPVWCYECNEPLSKTGEWGSHCRVDQLGSIASYAVFGCQSCSATIRTIPLDTFLSTLTRVDPEPFADVAPYDEQDMDFSHTDDEATA